MNSLRFSPAFTTSYYSIIWLDADRFLKGIDSPRIVVSHVVTDGEFTKCSGIIRTDFKSHQRAVGGIVQILSTGPNHRMAYRAKRAGGFSMPAKRRCVFVRVSIKTLLSSSGALRARNSEADACS